MCERFFCIFKLFGVDLIKKNLKHNEFIFVISLIHEFLFEKGGGGGL